MDPVTTFDNLEELNSTATSTVATNSAKDELRKRAEMFNSKVATDASFKDKLHTYSQSIAVLNSLAFGDSGGLINVDKVDKNGKVVLDANGKPVKAKKPVSKIVGYLIENVSDDKTIPYVTEEYKPTKREDGTVVYVGQKVQKELKPKEKVALAKKYMTFLCSMPEISFTLSNGKIVRGSAKAKTVDEEMEAYYFTFDDENKKVNSDTVKVQIGKKVKTTDGKLIYKVKPEYEATFGYLNNEKEAGKKSGTKSGRTVQDINANYIFELFSKRENM